MHSAGPARMCSRQLDKATVFVRIEKVCAVRPLRRKIFGRHSAGTSAPGGNWDHKEQAGRQEEHLFILCLSACFESGTEHAVAAPMRSLVPTRRSSQHIF